jgi:hypothetical protein
VLPEQGTVSLAAPSLPGPTRSLDAALRIFISISGECAWARQRLMIELFYHFGAPDLCLSFLAPGAFCPANRKSLAWSGIRRERVHTSSCQYLAVLHPKRRQRSARHTTVTAVQAGRQRELSAVSGAARRASGFVLQVAGSCHRGVSYRHNISRLGRFCALFQFLKALCYKSEGRGFETR